MKLTLFDGDKIKIAEKIKVNLWNDYLSPEVATKENPSETSFYVEMGGFIPHEAKASILQVVLGSCSDFLTENKEVKMKLVNKKPKRIGDNNPAIVVKQLSHDKRKRLVAQLRKNKLKWNGVPLDIISES